MFLSLRKEGFRVIRTLVQFNGKFKAAEWHGAEWHRLQSVVLSKNLSWPLFRARRLKSVVLSKISVGRNFGPTD